MSAVLEADRLYRFFHAGDDETLALRGVSLDGRGRRDRRRHRAVGLGQVDAAGLPRRASTSPTAAWSASPASGSRAGPRRSARACAPARIGVLYQQANLVGHLSVADNVALAQRLAGARRARLARGRARALRDRRTAPHARPAQLSGGELARAGLAVALANDPAVLLADEPTGELDEVTAARVLDAAARQRAEAGAAVLVVTHSPQVAARADREIRLRDGQVRVMTAARRWLAAAAPAARTGRGADAPPSRCSRPTATSAPARASRSSARPARASRRCCTCSPGSTSRPSARVAGRRSATARSCGPGRSPSSSRARACCRR